MDMVVAPSNNGFTSSGFTSIPSSPCQTPAKGGRVNIKSKAKGNKSTPQTPISTNAGKKNCRLPINLQDVPILCVLDCLPLLAFLYN